MATIWLRCHSALAGSGVNSQRRTTDCNNGVRRVSPSTAAIAAATKPKLEADEVSDLETSIPEPDVSSDLLTGDL